MPCVPIEKITKVLTGSFERFSPRERTHIAECRKCKETISSLQDELPRTKVDYKNIPHSIRAESVARKLTLTGRVAVVGGEKFFETNEGFLGLVDGRFEFIG